VGRLRKRLAAMFSSPIVRRVTWHLRRMAKMVDRRFFISLGTGLFVVVGAAALLITMVEKEVAPAALGDSFYWAVTTVLGQGNAAYVTSPVGWFISWLLALFGVALLAMITGALVGFVIDFLLKEGQGMGASGYRDHIVVCGWNATARDLIEELGSDDYQSKVVIVADIERNPAGDGVYFVRGDTTNDDDLRRAGIEDALAAIICPGDGSNEADMRSILTVLAIEQIAPQVRTVVEVNNPKHVEHLRRTRADEILVTSRIASRLLARSAMYPGLSELVTDIVSGGAGSELYRVELPPEYAGYSIDDLARRMRADHRATVLAVARNGSAFVNPPEGFRVAVGDDAVVVAESLGTLSPLKPSKEARQSSGNGQGAEQPDAV
jgi:voltage-gated potassium channel